ncbi:hypothetical protein GIB67_021687 [Kingdonia uniflora]|uniref:Calcineurin-like phosphoesterase domain-containing protein n=1 Tax=Kingdonia uniflora TaxID=39325 RepID=A0A7J7LM11_9MAGN|nr:hypothetical protein GIB67_021687 [Kingdonia uniflora]
MEQSAKKIFEAALGTPVGHSIVFLAHNGPKGFYEAVNFHVSPVLHDEEVVISRNKTKISVSSAGLGSKMNDICGKDWVHGAGDHGDPANLEVLETTIPHDKRYLEKAISDFKETTQSQFSAPLVVFGHMHKELAYRKGLRKMIVVGADNTVYLNGAIVPRVKNFPETEGTVRAFTLVEILNGNLEKIAETWVSVIGDDTKLEEEQILFEKVTQLPF